MGPPTWGAGHHLGAPLAPLEDGPVVGAVPDHHRPRVEGPHRRQVGGPAARPARPQGRGVVVLDEGAPPRVVQEQAGAVLVGRGYQGAAKRLVGWSGEVCFPSVESLHRKTDKSMQMFACLFR